MHRLAFLMVLPICLLIISSGCEQDAKSPRGFRLPDGDVDKGREAFVALNCTACHRVTGVDLPAPAEGMPVVTLGGEVYRVRTYGELVTSIINPSHTLAEGYPREQIADSGVSKMTNFNQVMTVDQLVHLVAFLQSRYEEVHPQWNDEPFLYYEPYTYP